jgi:hypothetical protein
MPVRSYFERRGRRAIIAMAVIAIAAGIAWVAGWWW